jgi:hypothetical protein
MASLGVEVDTRPTLQIVFTGVDLSIYSSIVIRVKRPDGTVIERTATIDSAADGAFHFDWQAGDLQYGTSLADIRFTETGGAVLTLPAENPLKLINRHRVG